MDKIIEWPSERVSQGGIFHQKNINYSKETHEMIKSNDEKMTINFFNSHFAYFRPLISITFTFFFVCLRWLLSDLLLIVCKHPPPRPTSNLRPSDLMSEAKLTMLQRNKINYFLRQGSALPQPQIPRRQLPSEEDELRRAQEIMERSRVMRRRPLDSIIKSGAFDVEK